MKKFKVFFVLVLIMGLITMVGYADISEAGTPTVVGVKGDRFIRMAVSGDPVVDPMFVSYWAAFYPWTNIYDTLVTYDENGNLKPLLAENWTISEDGKTWTFKLIQGAKFHDGTEVNASDVVFTLNRILTIQAGLYNVFEGIFEKIEAPDAYTLVLQLKNPDAVLPHRLTRLYVMNGDLVMANLDKNNPNYSYGEFGDYGITYLLAHDVGSGPYMVSEIVSGNYCTTVQFPDYHIPFGDKAPTTVQYINNNVAATQGTMLASKELEFSDNWQNNDIYEAWDKANEDISIAKYSDYAMLYGFFNTQMAPTDDANIRKAISSIVDYETIVKNILPFCGLANGMVNSGIEGASKHLTSLPYPFDLEKAAEFVKQSKYADTIGDYEIELFIISGSTYQEQIGLMMQAAAQQVGINLKITLAPFSTLIERCGVMESTPHISVASVAPNFKDASDVLLNTFASSQGTTNNMSWSDDPKLLQNIFDACAILDDAKRFEAYAKIEDYLIDVCYAIPFCELTEQVAYRYKYIKWPAAEEFAATGKLNTNIVSFQYKYHDFEVYPENF